MSFINDQNLYQVIKDVIRADDVFIKGIDDYIRIFVTKNGKKLCFQFTKESFQEMYVSPYTFYHRIIERIHYEFECYQQRKLEEGYDRIEVVEENNVEKTNNIGKFPIRQIEL